jgi:KDO2-lipid IV(A) lauroyltransferase
MDTREAFKRARDTITSVGFAILVRILRWVDYPRASALGARAGRLVYHAVSKNRKRAFGNLERVFGNEKSPDAIREIVKSAFENFVRSGFELVPYTCLPPEGRRKYVRIVGKEKLDQALARGRGVISLSAHLGNFLIMMGRLAVDGYHVDLVVKKSKTESIEEGLLKLRNELGYHSIYVTPKLQSVKASLKSLKNNHVLVLHGDQRMRGGTGIDVTFFGMPATAAPGPISLALSTGAPIVPMFMVRNEDGLTHTLFIDDPLEITPTGSKEEDIEIHVQKYTDVIQSYVERYPTQWTWDHKRWVR